ncbi:MAG TPA: glycosyl hydrolase [Verrucomicrobiae bacterium]|nr:glycosyl hydrolase [Verrucomicrobiae bacterium]
MHVRFALFTLALVPALTAQTAAQTDEKLWKGLQYRSIGPYRGGRVLAVTGVPGAPDTFYFGGASSGVWKTTDSGANWKPLFDKQSTASIGSIAVAPSDANTIYVGSGEACLRGNISYGDGVYKSTDAGKTWKNLGLKDTRHIGRVIVHPKDANTVLVAAMGHAFGPNTERGVFRTADGGKTWSKVLYLDDKTGAIDVEFDPNNPNIVFASLYQVLRQPWVFESGGPGSGLYRSADGGVTWTRLQGNGLPEGLLGRITISVSGADSNRVYAMVEAEKGGLFRSDDGGDKWELINDDQRYRQRAWYFSHIFADPKNADLVYVLNTGMFRSGDAGKSFTLLPAPHGDHHGLWIDPADPRRMINGDDGGATISLDGGQTWSTQYNQPTAQFYHVTADNRFPYYLYGAQQDNTPVAIASWSDAGVITMRNWYETAGSESAYMAPDPRNNDVVFTTGQSAVTKFDKRSEQGLDVSPMPIDTSGHGVGDFPHRFQWTEPIFFSPHDPGVLYTAGEVVFKTTDQGKTWEVVSPDLTRNDKEKQKASGGPITKDNTAVEYYDTIFALVESPLEKGLLWAGSDDGLIHITRNGARNWENVTPKDLPEWSLISVIEASPHDAGTAYVAVDRHRLDDFKPYILKTTDFGKHWTSIAVGIPEGAYVRVVREDPKRKGLLYAGTETGVWVSFDAGARWQTLQLNLPVVPVHDLMIKNDDLLVATHGRAFWILDDVSPLRQWTEQTAASDAFLFAPRTTTRVRFPDQVNKRQPVGDNPPAGAILSYYLKAVPKNEVKLEILDSADLVVKSFSSVKKVEVEGPAEWPDVQKPSETLTVDAGLNRIAWSLHYTDPVTIPGSFYQTDLAPKGPFAMPGVYRVRLTVEGKSQTVPLQLKTDPRSNASPEDLRKQFELEQRIASRLTITHKSVNQLRSLRTQVEAMNRKYAGAESWAPLKPLAGDLLKKLTAVEESLVQTKVKSTEGVLNFPTMPDEQLISLSWLVDSGDAAPTRGHLEIFELVSGKIEEQLKKWDSILSQDLLNLNRMAEKQKIPLLDTRGGQ